MIMWKGKNADEPKAQTARAYLSFFSMKYALEYYCYSPLDGMLVHLRVNPPAAGWRETKWSKVPCLNNYKETMQWVRQAMIIYWVQQGMYIIFYIHFECSDITNAKNG